MENSKKIIDWSLSISKEINLKAQYYTGLKLYSPNLFDIGIYITILGKTYYGRGSDLIEEIAYCKALSEAIERAALRIYDIENTNGLAVHPVLNLAKINARNELVERDAFLCHFLLRKGFPQIELPFKEIDLFSKKNVEIKFYELCNYNESGVFCIASGLKYEIPFGLILGSSYGSSRSECGQKALIEVMRGLAFRLELPRMNSINEDEFNSLIDTNFKNHGELALDLNYCEKFLSLVNSNIMRLDKNVEEESFEYEIFPNQNFPLDNMPLHIVRCKNNKLQNLYTGKAEVEKINLNRLSEVSAEDVLFKNINSTPHPFD